MASPVELKFDEKGLIPAIVQDIQSKEILMLAYMNALSFEKTIETGFTHFWSRSRNCLWKKVKELLLTGMSILNRYSHEYFVSQRS